MNYCPPEILQLISRFIEHKESYKSQSYNETQLRREFVDPFFKALGWDIDNAQGHAEAYKDVIHEDAIKVGGATKAPDYCFRIGGTRKFFVETKKPSVNLKDDISPAFQIRRYAWSAKLPLSILTDFEEFAIYDCRQKPLKTDKASKGRILYMRYDEYESRWDEIAGVFSKESILLGSFDKFADSAKGKKGTSEVDNVFLEEIERWRDLLARNIALRNPELSQRELNFAVQRTIDRIVFLRICEDRGIEHYGTIMALLNGENVYERMRQNFRKADQVYNSGLFHFQDEKGRAEAPDALTLTLKIDDKPLKDIIKNLYYPDCPYEFSVLPADILGQVYERFLGNIIRLTKGHQAKVDVKPEVKKAGGVFYTPTYVVDYIVKATIGKLIQNKTPRQIEKLCFLDPACGSGSFLIQIYQYLIDYHRDWYLNDGVEKYSKGKNPKLICTTNNEWRLSTQERKKILVNNVYGVDIDSQAVEVSKLSLLLKVLEGENEKSLAQQLTLFHERALPDLDQNIKCGNSLIAHDFYDVGQANLFDDDNRLRINAFNWNNEFSKIFDKGGFDAIIGNPPYIPIETMTELERTYYQSHFPQLERKYDSSIIFILAMLPLLKKRGKISYISSLTWQTGENYGKLRQHIFQKYSIDEIINLPFDVFKDAYVDTGIYIINNFSSKEYSIYRFPKKEKVTVLESLPFVKVSTELLQAPSYKIVLDPIAARLMNKAKANNDFTSLGDITISTQGLSASRFNRKQTKDKVYTWPFLEKGQVFRYQLIPEKKTFTKLDDKPSLQKFYEAKPRLLIRRVINRQDRIMCAITAKEMVFKKDINPFVITDSAYEPLALLALMNSTFISYIYINSSTIASKDDFRQTTLTELRALPIPPSDILSVLTPYAEQLLMLYSKVEAKKIESEKRSIERHIESIEHKIDDCVFNFYSVSLSEIEKIRKK